MTGLRLLVPEAGLAAFFKRWLKLMAFDAVLLVSYTPSCFSIMEERLRLKHFSIYVTGVLPSIALRSTSTREITEDKLEYFCPDKIGAFLSLTVP